MDQVLPWAGVVPESAAAQADVLAPTGLADGKAVVNFVEGLNAFIAGHNGSRVPLDLDTATTDARVRPYWGAVFANLLAGRYARLPLDVRFPERSSAQLLLARANVCFALARHADRKFDSLAADQIMQPWLEDWEPADVLQPLVVFPDYAETGTVPQTMEHNLVAFLNPDPGYDLAPDRDVVVRPWLEKLFGKVRVEDREWRNELYHDISLATFELLDNIQDHAELTENGLCSLSLFTTSGGSPNITRLYLSVWDNGAGVPATIAENYPDAESALSMVEAAVNGTMPHREAARGQGLNRVLELTNRAKGRLFIATGSSDPGDGSCVVVDHKGRSNAVAEGMVLPIPVQGTVVTLMLPIRAPERDELADRRA